MLSEAFLDLSEGFLALSGDMPNRVGSKYAGRATEGTGMYACMHVCMYVCMYVCIAVRIAA
jgi:hypothetical protein